MAVNEDEDRVQAHVLEYGFGPDDRYAWWTLVNDKAVVYDLLAGQIYRLQLGIGAEKAR